MAYAVKTTVPVEKTMSEIRKILEKAGACGFGFAETATTAYIAFQFERRAIKMFIHMALVSPKANTEAKKKWEQLRKSKWRALLLCIKAKVESIESGIETFDEAFLPHIILSNGSTVGQRVIGKIEELEDQSPALILGL